MTWQVESSQFDVVPVHTCSECSVRILVDKAKGLGIYSPA